MCLFGMAQSEASASSHHNNVRLAKLAISLRCALFFYLPYTGNLIQRHGVQSQALNTILLTTDS